MWVGKDRLVPGVEVCHGWSGGGEKLVQLCELIGREEGEAGTDEIGDQDEGVEEGDAANGFGADTGGHVDSAWMKDVDRVGESVSVYVLSFCSKYPLRERSKGPRTEGLLRQANIDKGTPSFESKGLEHRTEIGHLLLCELLNLLHPCWSQSGWMRY